jgi:hypothetical protein
MSNLTLEEAVKRFVKDFSNIPASLLIEAYKDHPEDLECLNTPEFLEETVLECWPAMWSTLFHPNDWTDETWIRENIDKVEEIGLLVYECEHCGILIGINSAGHDFYQSYWTPLYKARQLHWHTEKQEVIINEK